jgi:hypothetical protein
MLTTSITVSFPLGLFGSATMMVPPAKTPTDSSISVIQECEFLDDPHFIPETEGGDPHFDRNTA